VSALLTLPDTLPARPARPSARGDAPPSTSGAARLRITPTGVERTFAHDETIVSKTDPTGHIQYVNDVFLRVSDYTRAELLGAPHCVIRHPDMPRAVFDLLWERLRAGHEVFAYIVNLTKHGDHYWVFAHVTPSTTPDGRLLGYHSSRRTAEPRALAHVQRLYAELRAVERRHEADGGAKRDGIDAARAILANHLHERGQSYDEFVWSL
jgi:PAS domain S-box-containing protein